MRQSCRAYVSIAIIAGVLLLHEPVRHQSFKTLRLPYSALASVVSSVRWFPRLPAVMREQESLRAELSQRELEVAHLREALRYAARSSELVAALPSNQSIIADVIGRSPLPTQQTVLLNKGHKQGLSLNSIVLDTEGLIGRIISLQATTSLVRLLTDPESRIAGMVERSRETGLLVGRAIGVCEFIYLGVEADIVEGDRIMTAGLGESIPKGVALGTVARVERDEKIGSAWAVVKPTAHLGRLEEVLCVLPGEE